MLSDIKTLDDQMFGIDLISIQYLKMALRLFHSSRVTFELNIDDSSSEEEDSEEELITHHIPITRLR